jgi:hypothetical protein
MPCPRRPPSMPRSGTSRRADPAHRIEDDRFCSAVCPICRGPMTARLGKRGPYFHCRCYDLGTRR